MVAKVGRDKNDETRICTTMNNIESIRTRGIEPLLQTLTLESAFTNMNKISSSIAKCQDILKALKRVVDAANYTEEKMKNLSKTLSKQVE
jgi:septation ring formation regulator EzrA